MDGVLHARNNSATQFLLAWIDDGTHIKQLLLFCLRWFSQCSVRQLMTFFDVQGAVPKAKSSDKPLAELLVVEVRPLEVHSPVNCDPTV